MLFFYFVVKTMNWLVDIDGTVCDDIRNEEWHLFLSARPLPGALKAMEKLESRGTITYFTARLPEHRSITVQWLKTYGFPCADNVVCGKPRSNGQPYTWIDNTPVTGVTFKGDWEQTLNII